jgi:hypothetical protein
LEYDGTGPRQLRPWVRWALAGAAVAALAVAADFVPVHRLSSGSVCGVCGRFQWSQRTRVAGITVRTEARESDLWSHAYDELVG